MYLIGPNAPVPYNDAHPSIVAAAHLNISMLPISIPLIHFYGTLPCLLNRALLLTLSSICHERLFYVDWALCYPQPPK
jgi:hypothetical protein